MQLPTCYPGMNRQHRPLLGCIITSLHFSKTARMTWTEHVGQGRRGGAGREGRGRAPLTQSNCCSRHHFNYSTAITRLPCFAGWMEELPALHCLLVTKPISLIRMEKWTYNLLLLENVHGTRLIENSTNRKVIIKNTFYTEKDEEKNKLT